MHLTRQITKDIWWVGGNDRRLALFEAVYSVPKGMSYNSYLLLDDSTVLFDTVDYKVSRMFFENIKHTLNGRKLDFVVVQHMEPDHSATLFELLRKYPETVVICNAKTLAMIKQFFGSDISDKAYIVTEESTFNSGHHEFSFVFAPMVHWPEVMFTYDKTDKILFSADAFGTFGATNGAIFADEVDFWRDHLDEARRYYCNIVGKYGAQVSSAIAKLADKPIELICPLHGFVWRKDFDKYIEKYIKWSTYTPEENGVMIAYASIYGNTENAAEILSAKLIEKGIKTEMFDVSVASGSEIIAAAFKWSHWVLACPTYNSGIFVKMDQLVRDLVAHALQSRTVAFIENGSWAATSGKQMMAVLEGCKNMTFLENKVSFKSSLAEEHSASLDDLCNEIVNSIGVKNTVECEKSIDNDIFTKIIYGLFILTAKDNNKDNGCIINTCMQVANPHRFAISVNKENFTHDMILKSNKFNLSVISESADFELFKQFGFASGKNTDKFQDFESYDRADNGITYITEGVNSYLCCRVVESVDCESHTLFIADLYKAVILNDEASASYAYYHEHIKPQPDKEATSKKGFRCKICGYVLESDTLPDDYVCPLCKHTAVDFEPIN